MLYCRLTPEKLARNSALCKPGPVHNLVSQRDSSAVGTNTVPRLPVIYLDNEQRTIPDGMDLVTMTLVVVA